MRLHRRWMILLAWVMAVLPPAAIAGTTGKLSGTIKDEKGQPVAGANVRIEGQRLGGISDEAGGYYIIGIPAGTYVVKANLMGYAPFSADNVQISPDFTTTLDISMKTEAVQMQEVRVEAERPLLQRDATSTTRFITAEQIQRLPTRGYQDAAAQQAGIVNFQRLIDRENYNNTTLIIRGGRPNETAYYVDGFSQQDPLTGYSTTSINNNAIQEVVVLNGGFNAEYGRVMSGVVNVITREGGERYSGAVEAVTDNLGGNPPGAQRYDFNVYDLSLGGPIVRSSLGSFYATGQRRWQRDRSPSGIFDDPLPGNSLSGWTGQAKLSVPLGQQMTFRLGALGSEDKWLDYFNANRFNLLHSPRYEDRNRSVTAQFNHTLSAKAYYALSGSWFLTERKRGDNLFFDDLNAYAAYNLLQPIRPDGLNWFHPGISDTTSALGKLMRDQAVATGGNGAIVTAPLRRKSSYWAVKGDYTVQLNPFHQLKTGGQYDRHTLRYFRHGSPRSYPASLNVERYGFTEDGKGEVDSGRDGARHPITASYFVQDKYERGGLVVNGGLRWDYINTNVPALKDENLPLGSDAFLDDPDLTENKTYSRLSPRVGIGFPVSDRMVMHANWGHFIQQPNLQDLYASYSFLEFMLSPGGGFFSTFGNPNLKPEKTTAYEVGVAHQIGDHAKLDVSAYYRDVKDLVQVANIPSRPRAFASYRNVDFATLKGVDVSFTLRRVNNFAANVNYSLSFAQGTGSVSITRAVAAWLGDPNPPKQLAPLDFDQRHKLSVNVDYALGGDAGPLLGNFRPLADLDVNLLYNVGSGTPFTPSTPYDEVSLSATSGFPTGTPNSRYGLWTQALDVKASRSFSWAGLHMSAFVWVLNLFDTDNAVDVFVSSGSAKDTGYLNTDQGRLDAEKIRSTYGLDPEAVYRMALQVPQFYSNPRMVRFGLRAGF